MNIRTTSDLYVVGTRRVQRCLVDTQRVVRAKDSNGARHASPACVVLAKTVRSAIVTVQSFAVGCGCAVGGVQAGAGHIENLHTRALAHCRSKWGGEGRMWWRVRSECGYTQSSWCVSRILLGARVRKGEVAACAREEKWTIYIIYHTPDARVAIQVVPNKQPTASTTDLHDGVSVTSGQCSRSEFFHQVAKVLDPAYVSRHNDAEGSPGSGAERVYSVHRREESRV